MYYTKNKLTEGSPEKCKQNKFLKKNLNIEVYLLSKLVCSGIRIYFCSFKRKFFFENCVYSRSKFVGLYNGALRMNDTLKNAMFYLFLLTKNEGLS